MLHVQQSIGLQVTTPTKICQVRRHYGTALTSVWLSLKGEISWSLCNLIYSHIYRLRTGWSTPASHICFTVFLTETFWQSEAASDLESVGPHFHSIFSVFPKLLKSYFSYTEHKGWEWINSPFLTLLEQTGQLV